MTGGTDYYSNRHPESAFVAFDSIQISNFDFCDLMRMHIREKPITHLNALRAMTLERVFEAFSGFLSR